MFTVGQQLYFVPNQSYHGAAGTVTITKIGRKWIEVDSIFLRRTGRFAGENSLHDEAYHLDGGEHMSPGRLYLDQAVYEAKQHRIKLWRELNFVCEYQAPSWLTTEILETLHAAKGQVGNG